MPFKVTFVLFMSSRFKVWPHYSCTMNHPSLYSLLLTRSKFISVHSVMRLYHVPLSIFQFSTHVGSWWSFFFISGDILPHHMTKGHGCSSRKCIWSNCRRMLYKFDYCYYKWAYGHRLQACSQYRLYGSVFLHGCHKRRLSVSILSFECFFCISLEPVWLR